MSDNYNREDLDEEVNKVMEDNTEQDLSTVNGRDFRRSYRRKHSR